ncbi:MAG TPA: sulfur carrier protein ThiS [Alphaproteobacteria bacterium]
MHPSTRTASSAPAGAATEITLNGAPLTVSAALTIDRLVGEFAPGPTQGLAVAVNDAVVPRAEWPSRRLQPGDVVEIVRATRGG